VVALVLLAIVFIVIAVIGGSGGSSDEETPAPAPSIAQGEAKPDESKATTQTPTELGYPAFATNNTTRIGASDPAANAAATALAVFPSTIPAQRPAAVAVAGEGDWQAALAATVLMAAPVRAPLLLSTPGEMPDASSEALAALDPAGSKDTGSAAVFAIGDVTVDGNREETKVRAGDPATEAAAIAALRERLVGSPPAHFLVVPQSAPAFAMPAAAWAARSGDPILFSETDKLPKVTATVLKKHPKVPVYVLGPASAIASAVVNEIAKIGEDVHRVAGADPVANAVAFARYHDGSFGWNVNDPGHGFVLARDESPLDAAAAAPLSASGTWGPLLLTDSAATLPDPVREYFLDVKPGYTNDPTRAFYNHVWVIGDQEAIDVNQQAEVNELAELAKIGGEG
jgi:putative cell wall binding repeat protein